jgi:dephospho-CoA kinase
MPAYRAIVDHFGETILDTKKQIDRKKLQQLIFLNTQEKNWLENLLHPLIQKEMEQQTQALSASYCIWVVPLLLEKNIKVDRILVIDVPEEMQITRTQERDQLSLAQIHAILQTQMIRDKRLQRADDIIYNNGTLLELNEQIQQLHKQYLHLAAQT